MTRSLLLFPLLLAHLLASAAQQIPYCQVSQNRPEDGLATDLGAQPPRAQPLLLLGPLGCRTGPQARCRPSCSLAGAPSPEPAAASRTLASRTLPPDTCLPRALQRLTGIRSCVECLNKKCFYCNHRTSPIWTGTATSPVLSEVRLSWRRKAPAQLARQLRNTCPLWLLPVQPLARLNPSGFALRASHSAGPTLLATRHARILTHSVLRASAPRRFRPTSVSAASHSTVWWTARCAAVNGGQATVGAV